METELKNRIKELERINKYLAKQCSEKDYKIETLMKEIIQIKNK
jgi:hypothetical protein